jgi:hypothetical protein
VLASSVDDHGDAPGHDHQEMYAAGGVQDPPCVPSEQHEVRLCAESCGEVERAKHEPAEAVHEEQHDGFRGERKEAANDGVEEQKIEVRHS